MINTTSQVLIMRKQIPGVILLTSLFLTLLVLIPKAKAQTEYPTITNAFYDSDLRQTLMDIGMDAGISIVPAPEVSGFVTADLTDVPFEKALETILAGTGYVFADMGGYFIVAAPSPDGAAAWQINKTQLYALNYLNAQAAHSMLPLQYKAYTSLNPDGHSLCIIAPQQIINEVTKTLAILDVPARQIMLEARIVTMQTSGGKRIGMEYNWPGMAAGGLTAGTTFMKDFTWVAVAGLTPAEELSNALKVDMDFMITNDEASSVANPRVLASEGKEALISVMTEEYFKILTEDYYQRSTLEKVETGILLKIVPRIGANDEITLDIQTEVSDVISRGDDDLPVITRRKTTSKALVPNMGTVIISGLEDHHERINTKKIPILGYIPLLGKLFSFDQSLKQDSQVVVFITPHIMDATAPNLKDGELIRRPLPPVGKEFKMELKKVLTESKTQSGFIIKADNNRSSILDDDSIF